MQKINWNVILTLKDGVSFESLGLIADSTSFGVVQAGERIFTHSRPHYLRGYTYIAGFIWAENLANARRIASRVPVPVIRSGALPPDELNPYGCGWSYDEMFQSALLDSKSRMFFCNWLQEFQTLEIMTDTKEGFSKLQYENREDLNGKLIQIEGKHLYYDQDDLSAPYAVHYDIRNEWDG